MTSRIRSLETDFKFLSYWWVINRIYWSFRSWSLLGHSVGYNADRTVFAVTMAW